MLLLPSTQRISHKSRPKRGHAVPKARFFRLTSSACCFAIGFSDTAPTLFPRAQILQSQSEYYPLRTGSDQIRRSIWPNKRQCRCPSASKKQEYLACLIKRPPVFTSHCRKLISDQSSILFGRTTRRHRLPRL